MLAGLKLKRRKPKDRSGERDGHYGDQRGTIQERDHESYQRREKRRPGGQAIETIDEVECVGDGQDPQNGEGPSHVPRQMVIAKNNWDIDASSVLQ